MVPPPSSHAGRERSLDPPHSPPLTLDCVDMTSSAARGDITRDGGRIRIAMSTASTYPESTASAFEIASRLGFDGIEIMVTTDPVSQDPQALRRLSDHYEIPITSIH